MGLLQRHGEKRETLKVVSRAPDLAGSGTAGELDVGMRCSHWLYVSALPFVGLCPHRYSGTPQIPDPTYGND